MPELDLRSVKDNNPLYWADACHIKLGAGPFTTVNHEYQIDILESNHPSRCIMKATQGGFTEIITLETLHGLIHGLCPQGAMHLMPTVDVVSAYSQARLGTLIKENPTHIGKFVKPGGKGADTVGIKRVGKSWLYLRGASLTQKVGVGDDKQSAQIASVPVDWMIYDELGFMGEDVIDKGRGRQYHSTHRRETFIANPGEPGQGIAALFEMSDQGYWARKCTVCDHWTIADLSFPNCVKQDLNTKKGYIACDKCGRPVPFWSGVGTGMYVPQKRENSAYMQGIHWSHLTSAFNDPWEVRQEFENPPRGNLRDVYRLRLGLPYLDTQSQLTTSEVYACCNHDLMPLSHAGPCAMGVDVGKIKHVVIGVKTGHSRDGDRHQIVKVCEVDTFNEIHDLIRAYNVRRAVIDIRPYEDEVRSFQKAECIPIFLCQYLDGSVQPISFNDITGIVKVNRTEICDASHRAIMNKTITIPRRCTAIDTFAKQVTGTAKVLDRNQRTGLEIFRYQRGMGAEDHYRHALNYFLLASERLPVVRSEFEAERPDTAMRRPVFA
jgi:hypothetical protein